MVLYLALAIFGKLPLRMVSLAAANQHGAIQLPKPLHGWGQVVSGPAAKVDRDADGNGKSAHLKAFGVPVRCDWEVLTARQSPGLHVLYKRVDG